MGAVLAMTRQGRLSRARRIMIVAVLGLGLVSGCSDEAGLTKLGSVGRVLVSDVLAARRGQSTDIRDALSRDVIDDLGQPLLLSVIERSDTAATFIRTKQKGPFDVWQTPAGGQLVLREGMIATVSGFGFDVLSSDVAEVVPLMKSGFGTGVRVQYFLKGDGLQDLRSFMCVFDEGPGENLTIYGVTRYTRVVTERCRSSKVEVNNTYWLSRSGHRVVKSRQWFGPEVGYVTLTRLDR